MMGQTARAFKAVEEQMISLELDMKRYQEEIAQYDSKVKHMSQELENKSEQNSDLVIVRNFL